MKILIAVSALIAVSMLLGCGGGSSPRDYDMAPPPPKDTGNVQANYLVGECTDGTAIYCGGNCDGHGIFVLKYPASYKACYRHN